MQRRQIWRDVESTQKKKSLHVTNRRRYLSVPITILSAYTYITRRLLDTLRLYLHMSHVCHSDKTAKEINKRNERKISHCQLHGHNINIII